MDIKKRFGKNLQKARRSKNLSQEGLAFECGLHRTYISGIERGIRNPTITIVDKVSKSLGLSPSDLLR